jgi:hypothetical protein
MEPLGEGRNPPEEIKGWKEKKVWQDAETHTPGKCHITGDKLHVIAKTKKRGLSVWASLDADGDLYKLASRSAKDKNDANEKNENLQSE